VKSITAVLEADVMLDPVVIDAAKELLLEAVPVFVDKLSVTPAGTLLNVSRICVELSTTDAPLLPFCDLVLQQLAQPSVKIKAPCDLAILPLVKIVAVPAPVVEPPMPEFPGARPMARVPMPAFNVLITVPLEGEPIK